MILSLYRTDAPCTCLDVVHNILYFKVQLNFISSRASNAYYTYQIFSTKHVLKNILSGLDILCKLQN